MAEELRNIPERGRAVGRGIEQTLDSGFCAHEQIDGYDTASLH